VSGSGRVGCAWCGALPPTVCADAMGRSACWCCERVGPTWRVCSHGTPIECLPECFQVAQNVITSAAHQPFEHRAEREREKERERKSGVLDRAALPHLVKWQCHGPWSGVSLQGELSHTPMAVHVLLKTLVYARRFRVKRSQGLPAGQRHEHSEGPPEETIHGSGLPLHIDSRQWPSQ